MQKYGYFVMIICKLHQTKHDLFVFLLSVTNNFIDFFNFVKYTIQYKINNIGRTNMKSAAETIVARPQYLEQLNQWKESTDIIKIVTGVRRCGKSKLFEIFKTDLLFNSPHDKIQFVHINLEDRLLTKKIGLTLEQDGFLNGSDTLLDYIVTQMEPEKRNYIFLDEIQLLENWHTVVNTLRLQDNTDVYLTGSNAYMFSSDLANQLGGRYVEIKMQPYSFKEYWSAYQLFAPLYFRTAKEMNDIRNPFAIYQHYIKESGFPQTLSFLYNTQLISDYLLDTVYLNTIQKDVVRRFGISDNNKLDAVVRYLFDNIGNETSLRGIERGLKAAGFNVSVQTISNYLEGLLDSYLIYKCEPYDIKGKQILDSHAKYYVADIGLRTALLGQKDTDAGHILENIVYLELKRRGYNVSMGKIYSKGKRVEIDFVATKSGGITEYYQVSLSIQDPQTLQRELQPLQAIEDNYPKYILTMDYGTGENDGIHRINVFDWLMGW